MHAAVLQGGKPLRRFADLLHGSWLGHPLHPVLTDVTIGAWMAGGLLDLMAAGGRSRSLERAADRLTALGTASAVPTALAGLADYSTIPRRALSTGAVHGLINTLGLLLYLASMKDRSTGRRSRGVFFSSLALSLLGVSAWLGGELVYRYKVGVNKTPEPGDLKDWTQVMDSAELHDLEPCRMEVEGKPVLLYRQNGMIYAIGAVCGHDGGPLEQGRFEGLCVECPWHQTVYDLRDGSVVHGPSTYAEPSYETRLQEGKIEIRLRE
jgi:nitrite reductase/ring-hydroxylating ferredoxin subunit